MYSNLQGARLICFSALVENCLSFEAFIDKYKAQNSIPVSYEQQYSFSRLSAVFSKKKHWQMTETWYGSMFLRKKLRNSKWMVLKIG